MNEDVRLTAWVRGRVQGVGFRWFTRANALRIGGLAGFASNLGDGRVQVVAEGARERCEELLEWLRTGDTPGRVEGVTEIWDTPRGGYDLRHPLTRCGAGERRTGPRVGFACPRHMHNAVMTWWLPTGPTHGRLPL